MNEVKPELLREYKGIWIDDEPGIRLTILAPSRAAAIAAMIEITTEVPIDIRGLPFRGFE